MNRYRWQAFAAALSLWCGATLHGEVKVLKNFTLIDGTGRPPTSASAMIVDNGRITWVGPAAQLKTPAGAETVSEAGAPAARHALSLDVRTSTFQSPAWLAVCQSKTRLSEEESLGASPNCRYGFSRNVSGSAGE